MEAKPADKWAAGDLYEPYVGRWSRLVAREFLHSLSLSAGLHWLDVGCGTGALTQAIVTHADPARVLGVDPSAAFVDYARAHVADPRATFMTGDAQALAVDIASFDVAVAGLVLNFVPTPPKGVAEMVRAVRRGGVVAAYVWDYAGRMELMRFFWDAAVALTPAARDLDEGRRFPVCTMDGMRDLFAGAGLGSVDVHAIDVPTLFRDFDDYWRPFEGGQGPAPGYAMSLDAPRRDVLRERLRAVLPVAPDGSIPLTARAWAVRGRV